MAWKTLAVGALLVLACGKSREEKALEEVGRRCVASVGTTLLDAENALHPWDYVAGPICPAGTKLNVQFPGDACGAQSVDNPECQFFFEWQALDPGLCDAQGGCCYICELRLMKGSIPADVGATPICAARWLKGQLCQYF